MDEMLGLGLLLGGISIVMIAKVWILIRAFLTSTEWGLVSIFVPFGLVVFTLILIRKTWPPLLVGSLGVCVIIAAAIAKEPAKPETQTGSVQRPVVEPPPGVQIALTGAKREEYVRLTETDNVTAVRWANPDVTDEDAEALFALDRLEVIDLSSTQITDETVGRLSEMKRLKVVRIAFTKATAASIAPLLDLPNLKEIGVRGLEVPARMLRDWQAKDPQNRTFAR